MQTAALCHKLLITFSDPPVAVVSLKGSPLPSGNQTISLVAQQGDPGPSLLCSSDGSPPSSHAWKKLSVDSGINDVTWDVMSGEQGLAMVWNRPLMYEDSGHYICNANNNVGKSIVQVYLLVKSKLHLS